MALEGPTHGWMAVDAPVKVMLSLAAFGGVVAGGVRACDGISTRGDIAAVITRQAAVDEEQDHDLELLFQTQVRLTTDVQNLKDEVREVRKDLRAMDAGRPLPPLVASPTP